MVGLLAGFGGGAAGPILGGGGSTHGHWLHLLLPDKVQLHDFDDFVLFAVAAAAVVAAAGKSVCVCLSSVPTFL